MASPNHQHVVIRIYYINGKITKVTYLPCLPIEQLGLGQRSVVVAGDNQLPGIHRVDADTYDAAISWVRCCFNEGNLGPELADAFIWVVMEGRATLCNGSGALHRARNLWPVNKFLSLGFLVAAPWEFIYIDYGNWEETNMFYNHTSFLPNNTCSGTH